MLRHKVVERNRLRLSLDVRRPNFLFPENNLTSNGILMVFASLLTQSYVILALSIIRDLILNLHGYHWPLVAFCLFLISLWYIALCAIPIFYLKEFRPFLYEMLTRLFIWGNLVPRSQLVSHCMSCSAFWNTICSNGFFLSLWTSCT